MASTVCPYWAGYFLLLPLRRLIHNPEKILSPYVTVGMTALDLGPAMGYFTLPLARMVGAEGKVIAADVQESMLLALQKRAEKVNLADRIIPRVCGSDSLCLKEFDAAVDFALAFAVIHEIPDACNVFKELTMALKPGALLLVAEPKGHVSTGDFAKTIEISHQNELILIEKPKITRCQTALFKKNQ